MKVLLILVFCLAILAALGAIGNDGSKKPPAKKVASKSGPLSFKKDVFPIFKKYCLPCHSEDQMNASELYLESYDQLMQGGKHGKPVVAGKPDSSMLIQKVSLKPPFGDPMPMKRKSAFDTDTLKILRDWIQQGAKNN